MRFAFRTDYVELDYRRAGKISRELAEHADRLERLARGQMEDSIGRLSADWKGEGASAYLRKENIVKEDILRMAKDLRRTASVLQSTAERTYRAEMRARALGFARKYS
ncbi:MAG: hypothetical protein Q4B03_06340 [Lachnospiraceae bacterium]|nr:hypothetical protein [Lachnospiraceae bacterium]